MGTRVPRNTGVPPRMSGSLIMTPMKGLYQVEGSGRLKARWRPEGRRYTGEEKRDFIPQNARDGAEVSLRKPTASPRNTIRGAKSAQWRKRREKRWARHHPKTGWGRPAKGEVVTSRR